MERCNDGGGPRRIGVFVLTEITLEYFRLVDQHVLPLVEGAWTHRIVASDFTKDPGRTLAPATILPSRSGAPLSQLRAATGTTAGRPWATPNATPTKHCATSTPSMSPPTRSSTQTA
ncbi:hypothetical protein M1L21_32755 [Streptomyces sp. AS02]|nr:hypothetical protein [Streptomyces sp. AS02]